MNRIVYRGSMFESIEEGKPIFFSSDERFAGEYGNVKKYHLVLQKPFHTCMEEDVSLLLDNVGTLTDHYSKIEYKTYAELDESGLLYHDTWEIFEPFMNQITRLGYDGMIIYEGGLENYVAFDLASFTETDTNEVESQAIVSPESSQGSTYEELKAKQDTDNMLRYVAGAGSRLESSIYNSIEVRWLMDLEKEGMGHISITQYLNALQDRYGNGQSRMFPDLSGRRKPVGPDRVEELIREMSTYRMILQNLKRQMEKERKGSRLRLYAEVIQDFIDRIDRGEKIFKFDDK